MGELLIGTSGYSYDDWVGPFYPPDLSAEEYLAYYAARFPMTELNFSYYRQPTADMLERMVERTPPGFRFSIKGHRSMTHDVTGGWRDEVNRFVDGITPLVEHNRLLGVLLQFPYRFHYTVGNRKYLAALCRAMEKLPLFLEFRHREWQRGSVYDHVREMGLGLVLTDMPSLAGLPVSPLEPPVGGGVGGGGALPGNRAYIRFHGRNEANWWSGDNVSRYDYRYSEQELAAWVPVISTLKRDTNLLVIAFNNHANANAVIGARQLMKLVAA